MQALANSDGPVDISALDTLLDIAAKAGPALAASPEPDSTGTDGNRRRLQQSGSPTISQEAAQDALSRTFDLVEDMQDVLLSDLVRA